MFKKNTKSGSVDSKLPTSFSQPVASVIPKNNHSSKAMSSSHTTVIAPETEIFGDIKFSGMLEVEGVIIGNITANPSAEASVRIQDGGRVEGDMRVPRVVINGQVKGTVFSSTLELAPKAVIEGNVHYNTIEMMKGAQVNGNLVYAENALSQGANTAPATQKVQKKVKSTAE